MSGQLGGSKVILVGVGRRAIGYLLWVVGLLIPPLPAVNGTFLGSGESTAALNLGGMILGGVILVLSLVAALPGLMLFERKPLGYRFVDNHTSQSKSSTVLAKPLVQMIFECAALLLGTIPCYSTYRDGQHWLDRALSLVAVDKKTPAQIDPVPPEPVAQVVVVDGRAVTL